MAPFTSNNGRKRGGPEADADPPPPTLGMDWTSPASTLSPHARFIRSVDWARTPLGPPTTWDHSLHQAVNLVLADPSPAAVLWGNDLIMIYNESFVDFAGSKHPTLMGRSPRTEYREVWASFEAIIHTGRTTGKATRHKDVKLRLQRNSFLEECFVTYTFIPLLGPGNDVAGFYHTAVETTSHVLADRRTKTLLALGDRITPSRSLQDYWDNVLRSMELSRDDIPYLLAYTFSHDSGAESTTASSTDMGSTSAQSQQTRVPRACTLAGAVGKAFGKVPLQFQVRDDIDDAFIEVVKRSIRFGVTVPLTADDPSAPEWLFSSDTENDSTPYTRVLLMPIRPTTGNNATGQNAIGFIIVGLNPCLAFDEDYEQFTQLLTRQLATSAASVMLLEQEIRRQQQLAEQLSIQSREAQELERKFSRFAEVSNIGMWIASTTGDLLYANKAWYAQAGAPFNAPGFSVQTWLPLIKEESLAHFTEEWTRLMNDKVPVNFELQFKAPWSFRNPDTGEVLQGTQWFLISAFPEFLEDGTFKSVWVSCF